MGEFIQTVKQGLDLVCDDVLHELDIREQRIDEAVSKLITRKTDLTRRREAYVSLMERTLKRTPTVPAPSDTVSRQASPEKPSQRAVSENQVHQTRRYGISIDSAAHRSQTEERYKAILGKIAEQVKHEVDWQPEMELPSRSDNPLPTFEGVSKLPGFPKARGETYLAYRIADGNRNDFEKIRRCNEYYTQYPVRTDGSYFYPIVYVLDVAWFLKVFSEEVRHIEACTKYHAANWKRLETQIAMNESFRVLQQLIDEILNGYDATLQAAPNRGRTHADPTLQVRVKDHRATEKTVKLSQLRRKENRLYAEGSPVTFVGYLQPDISIIFPIPTFEVMNPHVLKQMRDSLASRQYESAFRQWRTCEIRLQELGAQYESELLEQLQTWLT